MDVEADEEEEEEEEHPAPALYRDLLGTLHIQSRQRRLVAAHRLDL
nr:hypothetical protein [Tanacetum cinerariifolium]